MQEIEIEGYGYSVPSPVYKEFMRQKEEIRLLRLHLEREKQRTIAASTEIGTLRQQLRVLQNKSLVNERN